jgi:hypothetical protein
MNKTNRKSFKYRKYKGGMRKLPTKRKKNNLAGQNIYNYVMDQDNNGKAKEICGITHGNQLNIFNFGPLICKTDQRGMCNIDHRFYNKVIWHTHPIVSYPFPSESDILSILYNEYFTTSLVYTFLGTWKINFQGVLQNTREEFNDICYNLESFKKRFMLSFKYIESESFIGDEKYIQINLPSIEYNQDLYNIYTNKKNNGNNIELTKNDIQTTIDIFVGGINSFLNTKGARGNVISFEPGIPDSERISEVVLILK